MRKNRSFTSMRTNDVIEALVVVAIIVAAIAGGVIGWFVSSLMKRDLLDEGEITRIYDEYVHVSDINVEAQKED
jgi:hypothetical protein